MPDACPDNDPVELPHGPRGAGREELMKIRKFAVLAVLTATAVAVSACGTTSTTDAENILEMIPTNPVPVTVPVDIAESGEITGIGNLNLELVSNLLDTFGMDFSLDSLPKLTERDVDWYQESGIQHLTVALRPDGLFALVNGEMLPAILWDEESLGSLVDVLRMFERDGRGAYIADAATMEKIELGAKWLPKLNVSLAVRFPVPSGQDRIPLPDPDDFKAAFSEDEEPGSALATVNLDIDYEPLDEDMGWVPSLAGFSTVDINDVLESAGARPVNRLRLRRDIEARLKDEGIESMGVEVRSDGVFLAVDDRVLPHLAWNENSLKNVAMVLDQLYPQDSRVPSGYGWVPVVKAAAPIFNDLDLALTLKFPTE